MALDCANGSAWAIAPIVFRTLGTDVHVINNRPDGLNINLNAGSTHIEGIKRFVKDNYTDAGYCVTVDEKGSWLTATGSVYLRLLYGGAGEAADQYRGHHRHE